MTCCGALLEAVYFPLPLSGDPEGRLADVNGWRLFLSFPVRSAGQVRGINRKVRAVLRCLRTRQRAASVL